MRGSIFCTPPVGATGREALALLLGKIWGTARGAVGVRPKLEGETEGGREGRKEEGGKREGGEGKVLLTFKIGPLIPHGRPTTCEPTVPT